MYCCESNRESSEVSDFFVLLKRSQVAPVHHRLSEGNYFAPSLHSTSSRMATLAVNRSSSRRLRSRPAPFILRLFSFLSITRVGNSEFWPGYVTKLPGQATRLLAFCELSTMTPLQGKRQKQTGPKHYSVTSDKLDLQFKFLDGYTVRVNIILDTWRHGLSILKAYGIAKHLCLIISHMKSSF